MVLYYYGHSMVFHYGCGNKQMTKILITMQMWQYIVGRIA